MTEPPVAKLPPELDYQVETLLLKWWAYDSAYRGAPSDAHASGIYNGSRARSGYDTADDLLAESTDHVQIDAVRGAVDSLDRDHREAVEIEMRNISNGVAAIRSNRLGGRVEWLYWEAKSLLLPLLRKRKVEI